MSSVSAPKPFFNTIQYNPLSYTSPFITTTYANNNYLRTSYNSLAVSNSQKTTFNGDINLAGYLNLITNGIMGVIQTTQQNIHLYIQTYIGGLIYLNAGGAIGITLSDTLITNYLPTTFSAIN